MYDILFRNKWVTLAGVLLLLVGVWALIGSSKNEGIVTRAQQEAIGLHRHAPNGTEEAATDRAAPGDVVVPRTSGEDSDAPSGYVANDGYAGDGGMADDAQGYDPTPSDNGAPDEGGEAFDNGDNGAEDGADYGAAPGPADQPDESVYQ